VDRKTEEAICPDKLRWLSITRVIFLKLEKDFEAFKEKADNLIKVYY